MVLYNNLLNVHFSMSLNENTLKNSLLLPKMGQHPCKHVNYLLCEHSSHIQYKLQPLLMANAHVCHDQHSKKSNSGFLFGLDGMEWMIWNSGFYPFSLYINNIEGHRWATSNCYSAKCNNHGKNKYWCKI